MSALYSIAVILMFLAAGMGAEKLKLLPENRFFGFLLNFSLFMLLFFMGFRIGRNEEIGKALKTIGIVSAAFAFSTAAGTAVFLYAMFSVRDFFIAKKPAGKPALPEKKPENNRIQPPPFTEEKGKDEGFFRHFAEPLKLVAFVAAGFASGWFIKSFPGFTGAAATTWLLNLLLFMIGAQLTRNKISLKETLAHPETALLPLGTIAGSLLGGLAAAPFLSIPAGKALALASGFGWYSLSGVIITDLGDPVLGSAGFLINLLRENIALLAIPFLARTKYPTIGIGVAGATSMDVTLPLIEKSCGDMVVPLSISNGAILSLAVPFLVPVFYQAF